MCKSFNDSVNSTIFPSDFKVADVTPIFKKGSRMIKGNYRPISILPNLSKLFEKFIYIQNYINISKTYFQIPNVDFGRVLAHNTASL